MHKVRFSDKLLWLFYKSFPPFAQYLIYTSLNLTVPPLMLPQELKQMPFKEEIVLLNGENPIKCEKALYFNDPYFMNKLISLSITLDLIYKNSRTLPSKEQLAVALNKGELAATIH